MQMQQYFGLMPKLRWQDVLDILIVAYVIYRIAVLIRGTRTMQMVVGLLIVAGVFAGSDEGQGWIRWAVHELGRELKHQVRDDGCDHEASTSYHRLVAELFIIGADAADTLLPGSLDPLVRRRIDQMLGFVADYTRPDGLAPQIGDVDDGRLLPLGDYGAADQRSHMHLFTQADRRFEPAARSAAYRSGGFYVLRARNLYAAVRCGDVGMYGRGCHAHNDLLAFELCCGPTPLIIDPGSYVYTADPAERNRFRSTAMHSTLTVDGAEQNELRPDRLFAMVDRARAEALAWEVEAEVTTFRGRHFGFSGLASPAVHTRTLRLDGGRSRLEILDEVESDGPHELSWSFPLAPSTVRVIEHGVEARFSTLTLRITGRGLDPEVGSGWLSPSYGVRHEAPLVRLTARSQPGPHRHQLSLEIVENHT